MRGRDRFALAPLLTLCAAVATAQEAAAGGPAPEEKASWEFNASVYGYFPLDDRRYAQPVQCCW